MNWTFGIVTAGGQEDRINCIIDSIESQEGLAPSDYEIVIVGGSVISRHNTTVIPFDEEIKPNWITRKKNLIAEHAKHEQLAIVHDYLEFRPGWVKGFEEFGDAWDIAAMRQTRRDGVRFLDWFRKCPGIVLLDYSDHSHVCDGSQYVAGNAFAVKRGLLLAHPMNESLTWGQCEDIEWSAKVLPLARYKMNPHSEVRLLKPNRYGVPENGKLNANKRGEWHGNT
jgi:hypothetical protein